MNVLLRRVMVTIVICTSLIAAACNTITGSQTTSKSTGAAARSAEPKQRSREGSTVENGWYSLDQAVQGGDLFKVKCAVCHGAKLQGGAGPALAGNQFFLRYTGKPLSALWSTVHTEMPLNAPGTLSETQSLAVVAYILQRNGFPAGSSPIIGHYDILRIIPSSVPGAAKTAVNGQRQNTSVVLQPSTTVPTQSELEAGDTDSSNWLTYGKGYRNARYSTLSDITTANAARLKVVCSIPLGTAGSFEASPIAYNGNLYVTTTTGTFAIDGRTCAKKWSYQYVATDIAAGANNKGVTIGGGRVVRGTTDGHLIAMDIRTGKLLWNRKIMNSSGGASAMAAPLIWHDLVFMGAAGGDVGVRGEISAYRVRDGSRAWSFSTVPAQNQTGGNSWSRPSAASHGGGGVWTYFSLDPATQTIFVPIGNPGPDFNPKARPGDNLFTTGIVALEASSGKLRWWYQTQPNDDHDWDATGSAAFDVPNGKNVVAATAKDGIVYFLDRSNGALLAKAATTTIANSAAPITTAGTHYCPGVTGGSEWNGAAWSPQSRLVYVNSVDWCVTVKLTKQASITNINAASKVESGAAGFGGGIPIPDPMAKAYGWTTAIDPGTGKVQWHIRMPTPMISALTPTAGGVVFTGDLNGNFIALNARNGLALYRHNTGNAIGGGVISYAVRGKQYVAVAAGNTSFVAWKVTGVPTLFVFSL